MRKSDIETHREGYYGPECPAINVKLYRGKGTCPAIDANDIAEHFGCTKQTAEQAAEFCYQSAVEQFWEQMTETATEIFGRCNVYSVGRSGGWLIVQGLPPIESWDAVMLGKWAKLCKIARMEIAWLCSKDYILDMIGANGWAEDEQTHTRAVAAGMLEANRLAYL